jgi:hypothetical protein
LRGATHHSTARARALAAAPALLRLAHQITGDPDAAVTAVVKALAGPTAPAHADEVAVEEHLTRALVRSLPRSVTPTTRTRLDELSPRSRLAATLAFAGGWDAEGIADVSGMSPGRVRTAVSAALAIASQDSWEQLLAQPRWALPMPSSLSFDVDRTVARRDAERRVRSLGVAAVAVALLASTLAVGRVVTAPAPPPPTAHEPGLLAWPPRGDLIRNGDLVASATKIWRRSPGGPTGRVYPLWAGHVGVGRLVVLQARRFGRASVAVVAEHDVTFRHTALHLDLVDQIGEPDPPWLAIPYDGNLNVAGLQSGPSQQVVQMLVRPDIDRVTERSSTSLVSPPDVRPSFREQPLTDGLSQPWLVVRGDQPTSVVRAWSRGRQVVTGALLDFASVLPSSPVQPVVVGPPAAWAGLPHALDAQTLADDGLWWAQVCHSLTVTVSLVWSAPRPPAARVEFVACPGAGPSAQVLLDAPGGTAWAGTFAVAQSAVIVDRLLGPDVSAVVVIGNKRVAHISVGNTRVDGRWALVPADRVTAVRVTDSRGRQLIP